tara:strand:+ start:4899 stop:5360 length:462 start_codon:yes stop_codon:yes gene_type:complete
MSIKVENVTNNVTVDAETSSIIVTSVQPNIKVQDIGAQGKQGIQGPQGDKGDQGDAGQGVPIGGTARQALTKIDGTDYNTEFKSNWYDYSTNVEYTGVETAIPSGLVLDCTIDGSTIYRFINSTNNANGYPTEDSFYSTFNNPNLSNIIVTRG